MQNLFKFAFVAIAFVLFSFSLVELTGHSETLRVTDIAAPEGVKCREVVIKGSERKAHPHIGPDGSKRFYVSTKCAGDPDSRVLRSTVRQIVKTNADGTQVIDVIDGDTGQTASPAIYAHMEAYVLGTL
ncbi:MAG: hypothetical protein JJT94_07605 [Bernardetiaceae bacterium]|nr:hypothetical protein [Bernardetiaceae bacterium]